MKCLKEKIWNLKGNIENMKKKSFNTGFGKQIQVNEQMKESLSVCIHLKESIHIEKLNGKTVNRRRPEEFY